MKIVEVLNGTMVTTIPFFKSKTDIPKDAPSIYFEAPDWVYSGCLYDYETGAFSAPLPEPEPIPTIPVPTNVEVVQQINDLRADLIVAGVIQI